MLRTNCTVYLLRLAQLVYAIIYWAVSRGGGYTRYYYYDMGFHRKLASLKVRLQIVLSTNLELLFLLFRCIAHIARTFATSNQNNMF